MTKKELQKDAFRMPKYALSRPHLEAIGLVAAEWSALEEEIHHCIFAASEVDHAVISVLTYSLGAAQLIEVLKKFCEKSDKYKPAYADLCLLLNKVIGPLRNQRNEIVHGVWHAVQCFHIGENIPSISPLMRVPKPTAFGNVKSRSSGKLMAIEFTPSQIRAVAKRISQARTCLIPAMVGRLTSSQRKFCESDQAGTHKNHRN